MRFLLTAVLFGALTVAAYAQQPQVTLKFDYGQTKPNHYTLNIRSDGTADYESYDDDSAGEDEHFRRSFVVSGETRDMVFAAAEKLNHFRGDFDFKKHKIAFTGKKTMIYSANGKSESTSFNFSENELLQKTMEQMEAISVTLEAEQRLRFLRRFDKLGLNTELGTLEKRAELGWLKELHLIAGCLQEISNDTSVVSVARTRAMRLMKLAASGPQPEEKSSKPEEKAAN
jgi:hypothetical protein